MVNNGWINNKNNGSIGREQTDVAIDRSLGETDYGNSVGLNSGEVVGLSNNRNVEIVSNVYKCFYVVLYIHILGYICTVLKGNE